MAFNASTRWGEYVATTKETVGTSSAALTADAKAKAVMFKAAAGNAGIIYVGKKATATAADFPLSAGDVSPWLPCENLSGFAAIASQASQELHVIVVG